MRLDKLFVNSLMTGPLLGFGYLTDFLKSFNVTDPLQLCSARKHECFTLVSRKCTWLDSNHRSPDVSHWLGHDCPQWSGSFHKQHHGKLFRA